MASNDLILAVDIGAWSIKVGEFESAPDGLLMKQFGYSEYSGNMNDENRGDLIKESLQKILGQNSYGAKKVHLSLSSQLAFTRFVKLPPIDENEERVRQIVEFEAKQHVPFEMNEVIWDYQLIGSGEELDVMFVVIKNEIVEQITSAVESLGLKVVLVDVASSSCYNASRANRIGDDTCSMVLSIGSRCSNLIFVEGNHFFSRNIPIAGYAISQQIGKEFGIGVDEAEELKQRHGFVALGGAYEEPESEVAATISKIVRNVMTRLHGEVNRSINIYRSQQKGNKPVKLFLAGGSSTMAFTETFFQEKLRIDCEYLNPFQGIRLGEQVDRQALAEKAHQFSEVIGIALRMSVCPVEISLIPEKQKEDLAFSGKKPFYYFSAVVAVLIPLVFLAASRSQRGEYEVQIAKNQKTIISMKRDLTTIKDAKKAKVKLKIQLEDLQKLEDERVRCAEVLAAVEINAPVGLWITDIVPIRGDLSKQGTAKAAVPKGEAPPRRGGRRGSSSRRVSDAVERIGAGQANLLVKGSDLQISGFEVNGFYLSKKSSDDVDDVMDEYVKKIVITGSTDLKNQVFHAEMTQNVENRPSKSFSNLSSIEIRLALIKPIGKK